MRAAECTFWTLYVVPQMWCAWKCNWWEDATGFVQTLRITMPICFWRCVPKWGVCSTSAQFYIRLDYTEARWADIQRPSLPELDVQLCCGPHQRHQLGLGRPSGHLQAGHFGWQQQTGKKDFSCHTVIRFSVSLKGKETSSNHWK